MGTEGSISRVQCPFQPVWRKVLQLSGVFAVPFPINSKRIYNSAKSTDNHLTIVIRETLDNANAVQTDGKRRRGQLVRGMHEQVDGGAGGTSYG